MILDILSKATTAKFPDDKEKFMKKFEHLYQLEILRPSLNLILTKCKNGQANFVITPLRHWDRCLGHCQTKGFFGKIGDMFSRNLKHEIVIRTIESDIIMHETAHAVEKTSAIDLNGDFRTGIGLDMKNRRSSNLEVANAVDNVMKYELKNYKLNNVMEELFARYFEMLAMSYEVGGFSRFQFKYDDIVAYFENTTRWVKGYFNPLISKAIDKSVEAEANAFVSTLEPYKKSWAENAKHTQYQYNKDGTKNWASGTKSTHRWAGLGNAIGALKNEDTKKIGNN